MTDAPWKICSTCKKPIHFGADYYLCSVSTCNRLRTGLFFCSVHCWDAHLPEARHRDAWAEAQTAPTRGAWQEEQAQREERAAAKAQEQAQEPARRRVVGQPRADLPKDILVVVSKMKAYVKASQDMKTSDGVMPVLSEHLRQLCDAACRVAAEDGRKTILDRDVSRVLAGLQRRD